ncbi:rod shape-determining protein RodA [Ammonifex thiophilus]|uniref:Peptidoglycan glycosyltransferase RodA n=1 Tax=Ammonifex thiophilus TaxID=444093 RepID=A0A3D8P526_9THEO|nr:rod shape-determining protein RodA [Ammonifex thiophilus]
MFSRLKRSLDWTLIATTLLIILYGMVAISSATHATSPSVSDPLLYVKRQVVWVVLGWTAALALISWRYEELARYSWWVYGGAFLMLLAVLAVGHEALGAQRWIRLGPFIFQPSEFAKLALVISLGSFLAQREGKLHRLKDLLPVFAFVAPLLLLVMKQPDLGTSLVFVAITVGMLYVAGAPPRLLLSLVGGGLFLAVAWVWAHFRFGVWIPMKEYQLNRIIIFLDPWSDWQGAGYHVIQSQIAIGSGGIWGRGLYQGSQSQLNFLPEQHTDFIFSVVGEELGFCGSTLLLLLYFLLLFRGVRIMVEAKDTYGRLLAAGIISMIAFHVFVNVGMTMGIMPAAGIPLPLFSYGGSSMIVNLASIGLLENIYRRSRRLLF